MTIDVGGQKLHVEIEGEGPAVLFLHGWGCSVLTFSSTAQALSKEHRVINLDFPGFGESPEPASPWSVTEYAGLVLDALTLLGIERCDIIGHSFGGRVALVMAASCPGRVKRLVLVDSAGILPKRSLKSKARVRLYKLSKRAARRRGVTRLLKTVGIDVEERIRNAGSEDYRALKTEVMRKTFVRVVNQDLRPCLPSIQCPALLIWGELDKDTPLYMAKIMEREIKDAALIVFEGAGHYSFLEQPSRFVAIVSSFCGGAG